MKKIIFILIISLPLDSFSQCPQLINTAPQNVMWLLPKVQQYFGQQLKRIDTITDGSKMVYVDSSGLIAFKVYSKASATYQGTNKIDGPMLVKNIVVIGTAAEAVAFIDYLKENLKNCTGYKSAGQYIKIAGAGIVWYNVKGSNGVPVYRIDFEVEK